MSPKSGYTSSAGSREVAQQCRGGRFPPGAMTAGRRGDPGFIRGVKMRSFFRGRLEADVAGGTTPQAPPAPAAALGYEHSSPTRTTSGGAAQGDPLAARLSPRAAAKYRRFR